MSFAPTKRLILLAAERVIASKGFGSARVDEIAVVAGVSKSHLYYHFDSKDELLRALIEMRTNDLLTAKAHLLGDADIARLGVDGSRALVERALAEVLAPHRDFLRILIVEGISRPDVTAPAWTAVEAFLDDTVARFASAGLAVDPSLRTVLLYFGLLPAAFHVALGRDADANLLAGLATLERLLISGGAR
jgi:AcrR family transcriptional regulator